MAHVGLLACLCNLTWDNVEACKVQGSCKILGSLRWPSPLCSTSQPEGSLCPTPGAGEVLLSETANEFSFCPLGGAWLGFLMAIFCQVKGWTSM